MAGDLIQKLSIAKPQTAFVPQSAPYTAAPAPLPQNTPTPVSPDKVFAHLEYSAAVPLSAPNTTPAGITAHSPSGHLVKENIFQSAASTVKSYGEYAKYFYKAGFKGEGTDYSVGKINDLTIRAGSLGIAGILAATKMFPFAKGMEFVGLGTWFASMAIWPKVIGAPVKAFYGVDPNQKYVDSYGRRKSFFEDPQYLPFDLYRHIDKHGKYNTAAPDYEYLNKIGDKLGVPRDIENRNEAIKDKMRQVATQTNALWMLTAGVMTPVVSSIAADALQGPLSNLSEKIRVDKAEKALAKKVAVIDNLLAKDGALTFDDIAKSLKVEPGEEFKTAFNTHVKESMSGKEIEAFDKFIETRYSGSELRRGLINEFSAEGIRQGKVILFDSENTMQNKLVTEVNKAVDKYKQSTLERIKGLADKTTEFFTSRNLAEIKDETKIGDLIDTLVGPVKKHFGTNDICTLRAYEGMTMGELKNAVASGDFEKLGIKGLKDFKGFNLQNLHIAVDGANYTFASDGLRGYGKEALITELHAGLQWVMGENHIDSALKKELAEFVTKEITPAIESLQVERIDINRARKLLQMAEMNTKLKNIVDDYAKVTIKDISESLTANNWNKVPQKYLEVYGFTKDEIRVLASKDMRSAGQLLNEKLQILVNSPERLDKAVKTMSQFANEAITKEEKAMLNLIGTNEKPGVMGKIFEMLQKAAKNEGFGNVVEEALHTDYCRSAEVFDNKFKNTVNSLGRPIKAFDAFKNIDKFVDKQLGTNADEFMKKIGAEGHKLHPFKGFTYEASRDALTNYMRRVVIENADINNWSTKHESKLTGLAQGFKYSQQMNSQIAHFLYDGLTDEIAQKVGNEKLVKLFNQNSQEMGARFIGIEHPLFKFNQDNYFWPLVKDTFDANPWHIDEGRKNQVMKNIEKIESLFESRRFELTMKEKADFKATIDGFKNHILNRSQYNVEPGRKCVDDILKFTTANVKISKLSGKDVSEFVIDSAKNVRSRNKWTKLVWSLFGGTVGLSAVAIALMGKKNYFNKDVYTYKKGNDAGQQ